MMDNRSAVRGVNVSVLSAFLAAAVSGCGNHSPVSHTSTPELSHDKEVLTVQSADDQTLVMAVAVPLPQVQQVTLDSASFTKLTLPGFGLTRDPGAPELPEKTFFVRVPDDREISFEIASSGEPASLSLSADLAFTARLPVHAEKPVFVRKDLAAYGVEYGKEAVEITDISYAGRARLATVRVRPVYYNPMNRELSVRKDFEIHFSFRKQREESAGAPVKGGFDFGSSAAVNGNTEAFTEADTRTDLVIAHESHRNTLARYLDFKREQGRTVREHYISGMSASQVKDIIKMEYSAAAPPAHTLLVGNISQIPSWRGSSDNAWTDFNYSTLDSGEVPDLSLGRIPAHNAKELNSFIDKAIGRETGARANNDDVLTTAGRDVSLGCPANVTRVGEKVKAGSSAINVIKKFRSGGASTDDVINAYNDNPNIVVYDGHGDRQGMQEIPLVISNLSRLTNDSHPIIFDIACLNANWSGGANARNFAETVLLQEGTGAAGILASGGSGYGHDFFQTMGSLMAQARQELAVGASPMNDVGLVVLSAKVRHGSQDRTFWNYYGDPATTVWSAR